MPLDHDAFACLYLNASWLTEEALVLAMQALLDAPPAEVPTAAAADAPSALPYDSLDWSAPDGLMSLGSAETFDPALSAPVEPDTERAELLDLCALGPPAVYDALPRFVPRIARVAERADTERLQSLMRELPQELPSLARRLTVADGACWSELLAVGCAPLQALVAEVRRLDPPV